jgi:Arc/MetJ family transcription regulator
VSHRDEITEQIGPAKFAVLGGRPQALGKIKLAFTPLFHLCVYMRTNIDLDEGLVSRGLLISGLRTKKDLVNMALKEFIRKNDQKKILELRGKIHWQGDLELMRKSRI